MRRFQRDPLALALEALGLDRTEALRLSQAGTPLDLPTGTVLCTVGGRGDEAFLLVDGTAEVDLGDRTLTVGPGAVIGELATLDPRRLRNATVTTTSPATVLVYDARTFRSLVAFGLGDILAPDRAA